MKTNHKTLCLIIHSLQGGGMERVMAELASYFSRKQDLQVHLILYGIKRDIFFELPASVIVHKPAFQFEEKRRLRSTLKTLFFLRKKITEINPDAVLSFGEYWNSFVLLSCIGLRYPVFVSDRCQPDKHLGRLHDFLRKRLYPKAAGIIVQTGTAEFIYQKITGGKNIKVIGNPVRAIHSNGFVRENIVLSIGRLIETKHHDELIKLFVRINEPGWKLIIVGDDALKQENRKRLTELIRVSGATDSVMLAGQQRDVESYYNKSKIFAFTSSSEGFPNVIGEAQSAGLPVIAFDCVAGPSEMISDNENGFLVPLFDYKEFEKKLTMLMSDETLRIKFGTNAKASIKRFDVNTIGLSFEKFILPNKK
jgi:GalNAc-alpha-(1->4)-GalNAc-alpha-(1->3)-diNAcBac-PP-undecaprenol alpha-1,4-N-acetyl-D-galactosaminyltransferase